MGELVPLPIPLEGTSPHQENLSSNDAGTFRCPNPIQTTTRNQYASIIYEPEYMIVEYGQYYKLFHNKAKKKKEKVQKSKGCWSSTIRKAKRTKEAVKNKAAIISGRAEEFYNDHIKFFLLTRGTLSLLTHMADVGTDSITAYSHYNNPNLEMIEGVDHRMDYGNWTVYCMIWPMLAAFIMCIMEVIGHNKWSVTQKCCMVALIIMLSPANSSLILLWDVVAIYKSQDPRNRGPSARKAGIMKLVEAVSESMPQIVLQLEIVSHLLHNNVPVPTLIWVGIATSIPSLAFTVATNDVFDATTAKASRAVWLFGCVVGIPIRVAVMIMGGGLQAFHGIALTYWATVIIRHVHGSRLEWAPLLLLCNEEAVTNKNTGATIMCEWFLLALICLFVPVFFIFYGRIAYNALALTLVVVILALALIYYAMVITSHFCGGKLKWTPWPLWQPRLPLRDEEAVASTTAGDIIWYKSDHLFAVFLLSLLSVSLCMFDSCCSISSLPISSMVLVIAVRQYPFTYWYLPEPLAMAIVALATASFTMNLMMTVIPMCRGPGTDWDNAWDNTMNNFLKWLKHHRSDIIIWFKHHRSSQPTRCYGTDDNENGNDNGNKSVGIDTGENDNNGYDNNGYENGDDDVANVDDKDSHSDNNVHNNNDHNII